MDAQLSWGHKTVALLVSCGSIEIDPMFYLALFLNPVLRTEWIQGEPPALLQYNDNVYSLIEDTMSVFFDWLFSAAGEVVGVELHVSSEDVLQPSWDIKKLPYVDLPDDEFPRVWFCKRREWWRKGLEAFDTHYYVSTGKWALLLPVDGWLTTDEIDQLQQITLKER
jgi:hypothetical protein